MNKLRLYIVQEQPLVGDLSYNFKLAQNAIKKAIKAKADLVVFSEMFVSGYPCLDLVLNSSFVSQVAANISKLAEQTSNSVISVLIGAPWVEKGKLYNAGIFLVNGAIHKVVKKGRLPNSSVFDEKRVFESGKGSFLIDLKGAKIGVLICEDLWHDKAVENVVDEGAHFLITLNASPYWNGKWEQRAQVIDNCTRKHKLAIVYVNQVLGQDDLIFDGASKVLNVGGQQVCALPHFVVSSAIVEWNYETLEFQMCSVDPYRAESINYDTADWSAAVLGLRSYVKNNGFEKVLLGLSGGIDSAVCAAIAVDALGNDNVLGVMMPYLYTSASSISDARLCAKHLSIDYIELPIKPGVEGVLNSLTQATVSVEIDGLAFENLQSRLRGVLLMTMSNQLNRLLISTGNKSELAVGYATLYGDMCGAYNPIKDIYKTRILHLARFRNNELNRLWLGKAGEVIPQVIISKAPTAELRSDQLDTDTLPEYKILDSILSDLIEKDCSVTYLEEKGHDIELIKRIYNMVKRAEFKRDQSCCGPKLSEKDLSKDRRYPLTNGYIPWNY